MKHVAILLVALIAVAGCSSGGGGATQGGDAAQGTSGAKDTGGKKLTVGFSQIGAESAWRTAETNSIRDEAAKRGVDLKFSDAQGDMSKQIAALHGFIVQHVDAIILAPKVEQGWDQALKEAQDAHIPVVLVDRGVSADPSLYSTLIESDFVKEGQRAADKLVELLKAKGPGPFSIVEIEGTTGAAPAIDRKKGFDGVISQNPNIKIVASENGDFQRTKGKEAMEAILKAHPNIDAVYAHNDDMAMGAIQAIKEAGKQPGKDILVVSVDGIHDALQAIANGEENCVIECNPLLGPAVFDAVEKAVKGDKLEKMTVMQDQMFDASNAAKALPDRKY